MNGSERSLKLHKEFGGTGAVAPRLFQAPGRVNIVGEHTDYTEGLVLPTVTALYTWIAVSPRSDGLFNVRSKNLGETRSFRLHNKKVPHTPDWTDYLVGVAALLREKGVAIRGADVVIDSDIPIGGGLSSSAALEVGFATALLDMADATMPPDEVALLCQHAEIEYAGVKCGVMDQYAVACCEYQHAILLDCRDLTTRRVPLAGDFHLVLTNSGVNHALPDGSYNERADECFEATRILASRAPGINALRDVTPDILQRFSVELGDRLYRRCCHVVRENQRVRDAAEALKQADSYTLGALVSESHESLRDDFEVSCDEVDALVDIANSCEGVYGSRMVGGGFGGCVLSVVALENVDTVMSTIADNYACYSGTRPWMHRVAPAEAARRIVER